MLADVNRPAPSFAGRDRNGLLVGLSGNADLGKRIERNLALALGGRGCTTAESLTLLGAC